MLLNCHWSLAVLRANALICAFSLKNSNQFSGIFDTALQVIGLIMNATVGSTQSFQCTRIYVLDTCISESEHYRYIVAFQFFVQNQLAIDKVPGQHYCHDQIQINDICVGSNVYWQPVVQWVQSWLMIIGGSVLKIKWRGIKWIYAYSVWEIIKWSVTEFLLISSKFLLIALTVGTVKYLQASNPILWLSSTELSPGLMHSLANTVLDQKAMLQLAFLVQWQQFSDLSMTINYIVLSVVHLDCANNGIDQSPLPLSSLLGQIIAFYCMSSRIIQIATIITAQPCLGSLQSFNCGLANGQLRKPLPWSSLPVHCGSVNGTLQVL
jgi:hypothetical protein